MRFCAATVEDAGFCPVMRRPSTTENGCQSATFSKIAPSRSSSSSTRNGTTRVSFTASSSLLVKPVTCLPFASGSPLYVISIFMFIPLFLRRAFPDRMRQSQQKRQAMNNWTKVSGILWYRWRWIGERIPPLRAGRVTCVCEGHSFGRVPTHAFSAVPAGLFISPRPTQDSVLRTASWAKFRPPLSGLDNPSSHADFFSPRGMRFHASGRGADRIITVPQRLKPLLARNFMARLKPCPSYKTRPVET